MPWSDELAGARDLYGALTHCGANYAILATTSGVSAGVCEFFNGKPMRVMDLTQILALHEAVEGRPPMVSAFPPRDGAR